MSWGELYKQLCKDLKINNSKVINEAKPILASTKDIYFLRFPTLQFMISKGQNFPFEEQSSKLCRCEMKESGNLEEIEKELIEGKMELK